jgi:hypothetical protein
MENDLRAVHKLWRRPQTAVGSAASEVLQNLVKCGTKHILNLTILLSYRAIRVFLVQKFSCHVATYGHAT